ncbi:DUF938 domain-containing protein [Shimia thalassica]|uniref:DUF938 domain-containing protein n=1 Tax=Shimia thalassica TaxID=1715693 RepID=UPI002494C32C|nr:DUF938 domain-containing protein [Shimia thalassica]
MPRRDTLPPTASVTTPQDNDRLYAPSAARNVTDVVEVAKMHAPVKEGKALELASGTGQHIIALATVLPRFQWQPTEVDADRRKSINAYIAESALSNITAAIPLDATASGWGATHTGQSLIMLSNLLHLISTPEAQTLIREAAIALAPGGVLMVYGPFMRDGELTSDGDASFHQSLQDADPEIGYKSDFDVLEWGQSHFLDYLDMVEMPANNLSILWRKPE